METTGFEDNIYNFVNMIDRETLLKAELKKLKEEKKTLEAFLIKGLELKNSIGVKCNGRTIELKTFKRKEKIFKILKINK